MVLSGNVARYARDHQWRLTADFDAPVPANWNGDGVIAHISARDDIWNRVQRLAVWSVRAKSCPRVWKRGQRQQFLPDKYNRESELEATIPDDQPTLELDFQLE